MLHIGETDPAENTEGTYAVTTDIVCPKGQAIEIEIFKTGTAHTEANRICLDKLGSTNNQGLTGAHITVTSGEAKDIDLVGSFTGIHEEHSGSQCGTGTAEAGEIHLDLTMTGHNEAGEPTAIVQLGPTTDVLTADGPVELTGTETGELFANSLTTSNSIKSTCAGSSYSGSRYNVTPHEPLNSGITTITITPQYNQENCKAHIPVIGTRQATITMNGCDYVLHIGETDPAENTEGTYAVTTDVVCPAGKAIEIELFKAGSEHTETNRICRLTIGSSNSRLPGLHLKDTSVEETDDMDLSGTLKGIHEEHSGSLCGTGTTETSEGHVDLTISAHNELEEPRSVSITD